MSKYLTTGQVGLYFLLEDNIIVYVGSTTDYPRRVAAHTDKRFNRIRFISCDRSKRYHYERRLIAYFKPKYNLNHNGRIGERSAKLALDGHLDYTSSRFINGY